MLTKNVLTSARRIRLRYISVVLLLCFFSLESFAQKKKVEKVEVAAVPLISYNKSFGGIFGAFATVYFPMSSADTVSPASMAGGGGSSARACQGLPHWAHWTSRPAAPIVA